MKILGFHKATEKKQLSNKSVYQQGDKDILRLKAGINTTENVWNKYVKYIEELIASEKITDKAALKIQEELEFLEKMWQKFKKSWCFDRQTNSLKQQIPECIRKNEFKEFTKKLTDLHHIVQNTVYPSWLDSLYQCIQTNLLKLYNCLFAGLPDENAYLVVDPPPGQKTKLTSYTPNKYNYFILNEKLRHNTTELIGDLDRIENWQRAFQLDSILRL